MMLILKAGLGALVVVLVGMIAKSRNFYLAGLVPLFPTFTLIAHYTVGVARPVAELKETILFSLWALIPYVIYLVTVYFLVDRVRLEAALLGATLAWCAAAALLIVSWSRLQAA